MTVPAWAAAAAAGRRSRAQAAAVAGAALVGWLAFVWGSISPNPGVCDEVDQLSQAATSSDEQATTGFPSELGAGWIEQDLSATEDPAVAAQHWFDGEDALDEYERYGLVNEAQRTWENEYLGAYAVLTSLEVRDEQAAAGYQEEAISEACSVLSAPTTEQPARVLIAEDSYIEHGSAFTAEWRIMAVVGAHAVRIDVSHSGAVTREQAEDIAALVVIPTDQEPV
jgi:hypothetical protein